MKSLALLTFALASTLYSEAQVTITNVFPGLSDAFTLNQNESEMNPGASGANAVWDYSNMGSEFISDYTVFPTDATPGAEFFPNSTRSWGTTLDGIIDIYSYASFEGGTLLDHGTYGNTVGTILTNINTIPIVVCETPLNYQDSGNQSYTGITTTAMVQRDYTGTSEYVVDAYGSITTPYGTFDNALRMKVIQDQTIETIIPSQTISTEYYWYVPEYPMPVMVISSSDSYFMGKLEDTSYSNTYLSDYSFVSGIANHDLAPIKLFPNPAKDQLTIQSDFDGAATLTIYSVTGKKINQQSIKNNEQVNVSGFKPGYYLAEIMIDNEVYTKTSFTISN